MHMQWRCNGHRGEGQALEVDMESGGVKLWEKSKLSKLTSKITENKTKQKQKGFLPLTPKPVNLKYASSSSLAHNNRLQFQTSCFAGSIRGCSNTKGGIEVKLANVRRRCRKMFFTFVVVNYQMKRHKRTNNDLQNITQKTNDRATCICISVRKRGSILL